MSNEPQAQDPAAENTEPEPVEPEPALPTAEELASARPATLRHAPKFGAFLVTGALVGMFLALLLTALIGPEVPRPSDGSGFLPFLDGENAVRTVMAVTGAVVGAFLGGLLAVLADRRSVRRARTPSA